MVTTASGKTALRSLYKSHEITPADLNTRQDIIDYFGQERRNVVFVLRRTSTRSQNDVLHKRLRHFLKCVSETDIDVDLIGSQVVLPTTLDMIFSCVANHKEGTRPFLPEEQYCAKLLYADYLLNGWHGRATAFTWADDEWYPFSQVNAFKPPMAPGFHVRRERTPLLRHHSESGVATRHAHGNAGVKAVTFNDVTSVIEYDHLSHGAVQRSVSLDTGRGRGANHLTRYPVHPPRIQQSQSSPPYTSSPVLEESSSPALLDASNLRGFEVTRRPDPPRRGHPPPPASRTNSPVTSASPTPSERNSEPEPEKSAQPLKKSPPPKRYSRSHLRSPSPAHAKLAVSPLRQVSTMSPILAPPESTQEMKKVQVVSLVESINKLRSQVESIDIRELPMAGGGEHVLLTERTASSDQHTQPADQPRINAPIEQTQEPQLRKVPNGLAAKRYGHRSLLPATSDEEHIRPVEHTPPTTQTESNDQAGVDTSTEQSSETHQEPPMRKVPRGVAAKRYGRRSLTKPGPVKLRVFSIEQKSRPLL